MTNTLEQVSRGYTTNVITPWGLETYQVWLHQAEEGWIARIVTLPNRMWALPGGREAVKFLAPTPKQAEAAAVRFIEEECIRTSRRMAPPIDSAPPAREQDAEAASVPTERIATRYPHRLLVKFGTAAPDRPGVTANLSETGMFIITDQPATVGATVLIDLRLPSGRVVLGGEGA